ncbi:MAG: GIY-YIG nuclease family protein [Ignavibacteriaceae bacterium]
MFTVYVIYSIIHKKIYVGQTNDLSRRLYEHNNGLLSSYTKRYTPWELLYKEEYNTRSEAVVREKQLKSSRGRAFIWQLVKQKYE